MGSFVPIPFFSFFAFFFLSAFLGFLHDRCHGCPRGTAEIRLCCSKQSHSLLDHGGSNWAARMATTLMTLHIAPYAEGLAAAGMCATERLLASVAVGVDAQAGGPRKGLVACPADVAIMVLLVRRGTGRGEVVVMLPGGGDGRNHLLMTRGGKRCCGCLGEGAWVLEGVRRRISLVVSGS